MQQSNSATLKSVFNSDDVLYVAYADSIAFMPCCCRSKQLPDRNLPSRAGSVASGTIPVGIPSSRCSHRHHTLPTSTFIVLRVLHPTDVFTVLRDGRMPSFPIVQHTAPN